MNTLGWDIGGANIKAALIKDLHQIQPEVLEQPFALWREPDRLGSILSGMAGRLGAAPRMAVTMTAELADCFATKRDGVGFVLDALGAAFPEVDPLVYGVDGRFRSVDEARRSPFDVAAANWRASAAFIARRFSDALFVDVGSTTTDVIPIVAGRVAAEGRTDTARLGSGELVYTGALRTPVCAIVRKVPVGGRRCRVAAEHFAIAADVYRWLGRLDECEYTCETPDGRGRSRAEAGARLARTVCADQELLSSDGITAIADFVSRVQVRHIAGGLRQVMRRLGSGCPDVAVLAGQGAFLGRLAAQELGLATRDLASELGYAAARSAPAAAVAYLLAEIDASEGEHGPAKAGHTYRSG